MASVSFPKPCAPSRSRSTVVRRSSVAMDWPASAMKLHVRKPPKSVDGSLGLARSTSSRCSTAKVRRNCRRGGAALGPCATRYPPEHRVIDANGSETTGLESTTDGSQQDLRVHDPDRRAEELKVGEASGWRPLPLRVGVYGIISDEEEDLGTLTGSLLPIQEALCRSGSGSCSG
jgi:hypothetical protein